MELFRALGALTEPPRPGHTALAELLGLSGRPDPEAHHALFSVQLYPYASVYLGEEGMLGGEAQDRIAGFWRVFGGTPPAEPDHLATLLSAYASLCERDSEKPIAESGWGRARRAFYWEHLASWIFIYLERVLELGDGFYRSWAGMLRQLLLDEARLVPDGAALPLHLRESTSLALVSTGNLDEIIPAILAPIRSGIVLTRADLTRASQELGLGLRIGERRIALHCLMAQEPERVLRWLGDEARRQSARPPPSAPVLRSIAEFWASRSIESVSVLESMRSALG
jgi:hypothetical protein